MVIVALALLSQTLTMPFESTVSPAITKETEQLWIEYLIARTEPPMEDYENRARPVPQESIPFLVEVCSHGPECILATAADPCPIRFWLYGPHGFNYSPTAHMLEALLANVPDKPVKKRFVVGTHVTYHNWGSQMAPMMIQHGKLKVVGFWSRLIGGQGAPAFPTKDESGDLYDSHLRDYGPRDLTPYLGQRFSDIERAKYWTDFQAAYKSKGL